jgi:hypothetical protein
MSSSNSYVNRLMAGFESSKGLRLNIMYLAFLAVALMLVGIQAYTVFTSSNYGQFQGRLLAIVAAIVAGVAGHLLQGPFQVFSVILFIAVLNFFTAHYKHFDGLSGGALTAALAEMKRSAEILFWVLLFFGLIYLVFVFVPMFQSIIPTAENAYKEMKLKQSAPKLAAPAVSSPAPSA